VKYKIYLNKTLCGFPYPLQKCGHSQPARVYPSPNIHTKLLLPAGSVSPEFAFSQTSESFDVCVGVSVPYGTMQRNRFKMSSFSSKTGPGHRENCGDQPVSQDALSSHDQGRKRLDDARDKKFNAIGATQVISVTRAHHTIYSDCLN